MTPFTRRRPRGSSSFANPPLALTVSAAMVLLVIALWMLGVLDGSWFRAKPPSTAGMVPVPTLSARLPAYTRIRRDHIWDLRNNRPTVVYLPPGAVTKEMLTRLSDIIGRVVAYDKSPGYVFTEADFLPKGTREGLVGGIPAGKRAVRIAAEQVDGLHGLRLGDRFDLLATMPIDGARGSGQQSLNFAGAHGQQMALEARLSNWQKQATVRVMVENAVVVTPMSIRAVPTYQSTLTEEGATRTRAVQEAVIAVHPEEVARLTEAIAVGAKITAVPRSGRPDDPVDSRTPDLRPVSPFIDGQPRSADDAGGTAATGQYRMVETIMGQKRELTAVPKR